MDKNLDLFAELSPHAYDKLAYFKNQGIALMPGTTVCVMVSATNRWYCEISNVTNINGSYTVSHAERDVLKTMENYGDAVVQYILLLNENGQPIIPCAGCIQYILNANPQNANAYMVLPNNDTRLLKSFLPNYSMPNSIPPIDDNAYPVPNTPYTGMSPMNNMQQSVNKQSANISVKVQTDSSNGNILKDRLSELKGTVNTEVEAEEIDKKKRFFGLF